MTFFNLCGRRDSMPSDDRRLWLGAWEDIWVSKAGLTGLPFHIEISQGQTTLIIQGVHACIARV